MEETEEAIPRARDTAVVEPKHWAKSYSAGQLFAAGVIVLGLVFLITDPAKLIRGKGSREVAEGKKPPAPSGGSEHDLSRLLRQGDRLVEERAQKAPAPVPPQLARPPERVRVAPQRGQQRDPAAAAFENALLAGTRGQRIGVDEQVEEDPAMDRFSEIAAAVDRTRTDGLYSAGGGEAAPPPVEAPAPVRLVASPRRREGRVIPRDYRIRARIEHGINSDLAGPVVAMVESPVVLPEGQHHWVTVLPQGTRFHGHYQQELAAGQNRLFVLFDTLSLPDGTSYDIGRQYTMDLQGYSGVRDQVNHHTWQLLGKAAAIGLISAGFEVGRDTVDQSERLSAYSRGANGVVSEFEQAARTLLEREADRQPTIVIRPGTEILIQMNQELELLGL